MENLSLEIMERKPGRIEKNKVRRNGYVPGIIYGPDLENILISVKENELLKLLKKAESKIINLSLGATQYPVLLKNVQRNPITAMPLSIDFYRIKKAHKITIEVPIHLIGDAVGVKQGGVLEHNVTSIEIETLPSTIPESIDIDISNLDIGDHISVANLPKMNNIMILEKKETVIVSVAHPTIEKEVPAAPEEETKESETEEKDK